MARIPRWQAVWVSTCLGRPDDSGNAAKFAKNRGLPFFPTMYWNGTRTKSGEARWVAACLGKNDPSGGAIRFASRTGLSMRSAYYRGQRKPWKKRQEARWVATCFGRGTDRWTLTSAWNYAITRGLPRPPTLIHLSKKRRSKTHRDPRATLKAIRSRNLRPNRAEIRLGEMLCALGVNAEYVGNGKRSVGRFVPDFIDEANGKIVELFGEPWHPDPREADERASYFRGHGYDTLVVWSNELKSGAALDRIRRFYGLDS